MKASVQQKDKKKMQPILLYGENNNVKILVFYFKECFPLSN